MEHDDSAQAREEIAEYVERLAQLIRARHALFAPQACAQVETGSAASTYSLIQSLSCFLRQLIFPRVLSVTMHLYARQHRDADLRLSAYARTLGPAPPMHTFSVPSNVCSVSDWRYSRSRPTRTAHCPCSLAQRILGRLPACRSVRHKLDCLLLTRYAVAHLLRLHTEGALKDLRGLTEYSQP